AAFLCANAQCHRSGPTQPLSGSPSRPAWRESAFVRCRPSSRPEPAGRFWHSFTLARSCPYMAWPRHRPLFGLATGCAAPTRGRQNPLKQKSLSIFWGKRADTRGGLSKGLGAFRIGRPLGIKNEGPGSSFRAPALFFTFFERPSAAAPEGFSGALSRSA